MASFHYNSDQLYAEGLPVADLAATYGTPLYLYSRNHLVRQFNQLSQTLDHLHPLICFAVKSNTNAAVIDTFAQLGAGADVVSGGELFRCLKAGMDPSKIVFAGVGKQIEEIAFALKHTILYFTVESEPELTRISEVATDLGVTARVAIRVNPDVDPKTHKYTSTGKKENKFGVDLERAANAYESAGKLPHLEIAGLHMHLGSPISNYHPYVEALEKVKSLCLSLRARYPSFRHIDIGGGLSIPYRHEEKPFDLEAFSKAITPLLKELALDVSLEPGRFLTGNAGLLITRVEYIKENPFKKFVIVDAAMNDLLRPALYEAYHEILPVKKSNGTVFGDLVGPVCESGDFLAADRELPLCKQGDLLAVSSAGAYGFVMASNYNSRGRAAEVMVNENEHALVRARELWDDLTKGETIPAWEPCVS